MSASIRKRDFVEERYTHFEYIGEEKERIRISLSLMPLKAVVLDVGCGDGQISRKIAQKQDAVIGVDLSLKLLREAKNLINDVVCCDVERGLPFRDGFFDVISAQEIIEHVLDTDYFVKECYRCLKAGGILVLSTPNLAGLGCRIALLLGKRPWPVEYRLGKDSAGHMRCFTVRDLKQLLANYNFSVNKITTNMIKLGPIKLRFRMFPQIGLHIIFQARKIQ